MENKLVSKSFYLTSLFADIKSDHTWTTYEAKLAMLLISQLNKYKLYLPDLEDTDVKIELDKIIKEVPQEYTFHRSKFIEITGVANSVVSREIKKVVKGLLSKTMIMPHPLEDKDSMSVYGITWFSKIEYSNKTGNIKVRVNEEAILRLIAFAKYSKISFDSIIKIQNHNSIYSYLFFKILRDSSNYKELNIDIHEFKEKIGLKNKYKEIKHLKIYVLEVIKKDINSFTEISLDYELIKEGRAFTKIKFTFDYKPEHLEQKTKSTNKPSKEPQIIDSFNEVSDSPFEHVLTGWGIRAKKVVEIEETYSLDVIQSAIDLTLEKEAAGEITKTKAAMFLGILENQQNASEEIFAREKQKLIEQQEKEYQKQLASEYDAIQKFINDNEDELSKYLSAKSLNIEYPLNDSIREQVSNLACVDAEKFKAFRPKLPVLHEGYFDMKKKKEIRPNMYSFLNILKI
ncbi:replication initiation protein [Allofrancisella guangzhouensis]|uniref:replication initiation protein n=1 Tax=Allofrancisella guangzhouensis TaxID=594679 RepID=UPI0019078F63|nr:replication initiation protein [Allofrancisella guangzhouensis]MBK2044396.1 replication initiation protein [Allofrancisella guangzhouensis]MBK2046225.1 replication initiation protein [Allofrancisella guangzhouensis]